MVTPASSRPHGKKSSQQSKAGSVVNKCLLTEVLGKSNPPTLKLTNDRGSSGSPPDKKLRDDTSLPMEISPAKDSDMLVTSVD
jgi:hypothetical protein